MEHSYQASSQLQQNSTTTINSTMVAADSALISKLIVTSAATSLSTATSFSTNSVATTPDPCIIFNATYLYPPRNTNIKNVGGIYIVPENSPMVFYNASTNWTVVNLIVGMENVQTFNLTVYKSLTVPTYQQWLLTPPNDTSKRVEYITNGNYVMNKLEFIYTPHDATQITKINMTIDVKIC
ncbi:hypothetical protein HELRODRAFT_178291 [Helobdella robusta]|uniref:Uncharacterized protein n=1 Tax=Helobdella robusta TaxID=6412 RepID=T1FD17_HELRO|nr:hypothetical protein HELRODRAFT_178291 [Helobdella robusta]ESN97181.1 hypothetical protein HELRODRAFT_178291 [Helobdella robusta]